MGSYSAHWAAYAKASRKGLVHLGLLLVLGLPGTALLAYGVSRVTGEYPVVLHIGLLALWLVAFTWLTILYSRVDCPRCGLRMLQEEP